MVRFSKKPRHEGFFQEKTGVIMQPHALSTSSLRLALLSFVLCIGALWLIQPASGETLAQQEAQLDQLYHELLADPTNVDKTLSYAELAVEIGDYEAAIPPLERLLISNPGAAKLKLELGILYYLLGSNDAARTYLEDAKATQGASDLIIQQSNEYLAKM